MGIYFGVYFADGGGYYPRRREFISSGRYWYEVVIRGDAEEATGWPLWCPDDPHPDRFSPDPGLYTTSYGYNSFGLGVAPTVHGDTLANYGFEAGTFAASGGAAALRGAAEMT